MSVQRSFGQWIKQQRRALDLTQAELASRVHCSTVTIQKIEEGNRRPSKELAVLLAEQLAIAPEQREHFLRLARTPESEEAPSGVQATAPTNLPAPLTPLLGRTAELATLRSYLTQSTVRLVTIVGPAGVGKTRLSIALGQAMLKAEASAESQTFPDGIFFIPLAAVSDPALVPITIAHLLGVTEKRSSTPLHALQHALRHRRMLLLLDNFEQIADAAPLVAELLIACPQLKALATSRVPLRVRGEQEVPLEPFALPATATTLPLADLRRWPALTLFRRRVQAFQPNFALDTANIALITEICARLDGLPLAIELAAARLRQFSAESLLAHLRRSAADSLHLLTDGPRDLPVRHQTLRNALHWSYDLLPPAAQRGFAQLSVFVGGFTYAAAAALIQGSAPHGQLGAILQLLCEQSLLQRNEIDGTSRFTMLVTIHAFAAEQLAASGEAETLRRRHADYFQAVTREPPADWQGQAKKAWQDQLEREHDNLRAALRWLLTIHDAGALQLAGALSDFWYTRGYHYEARAWLGQVLARHRAPTAARARVLVNAGKLAQNQGDAAEAAHLLKESLTIYRALGDQAGVAEAVREYGWAYYNLHDRPSSLACFEESLQLYRTIGDQFGIAHALIALAHVLGKEPQYFRQVEGYLHEASTTLRALGQSDGLAYVLQRQGELALYTGDYRAGAEYYHEALTLFEGLGLQREIAWTHAMLGEINWLQRDLTVAQRHLQQALARFTTLGDRDGEMIAQHHLGQVARAQKRFGEATQLYRQSLHVAQTLGNRHMTARGLAGLGGVALGLGETVRAAQLLGAAQALFDTLPPFLTPGDQAEYAELIEATRQALGEESFAAAWAIGAQHPSPEQIENRT